MDSTYIDSGAQLSACGRYRFTLWRVWDEARPVVVFVGLNPSTADALKDDQTIRRCRHFADASEFGGLTMLNLWAFRATHPSDLPAIDSPEEQDNLDNLARVCSMAARVVAVWGDHPKARLRTAAVMPIVSTWWCLGKTKHGHPRHPSRLGNGVPMVRM